MTQTLSGSIAILLAFSSCFGASMTSAVFAAFKAIPTIFPIALAVEEKALQVAPPIGLCLEGFSGLEVVSGPRLTFGFFKLCFENTNKTHCQSGRHSAATSDSEIPQILI